MMCKRFSKEGWRFLSGKRIKQGEDAAVKEKKTGVKMKYTKRCLPSGLLAHSHAEKKRNRVFHPDRLLSTKKRYYGGEGLE